MFRRYNRWHSRFDQPDPYVGSYSATDPQSFNRYSYVNNDPVNFTDPSGLQRVSCFYMQEGLEDQRLVCILAPDVWNGFQGGRRGGQLPAAANEPHPQARRNPSCYEFVNELVDRVFNSWFLTETGQGISMETEGIRNPYEKEMPYSKGNPNNDFKYELTDHGQNGDVYRHILFVAGTILAGDSHIRDQFIAYDQKQADSGRKESIAELADDRAGIDVGNLMDSAWNGKLNADQLQDALTRRLCNN